MQKEHLRNIVQLALLEDIGTGDVTTNNLISSLAQAQAKLIFKSEGIVCGLNVAECAFKILNNKIRFKSLVKEGSKVKKGQAIALIQGSARGILTAERVAINFLTHLSGVATRTNALVSEVKPYKAKILDTRKTTPLLRELERYAVRVGGGVNHRFDLSEMAMIKDNHRLMIKSQGFSKAVNIIKNKTKKRVVLEVDTWEELKEALQSKAEVILLDNMTPAQVHKAVLLRNKINSKILLEASGGIKLDNVRAYAKAGVDRISVGSLTSSKSGIDISLDFFI